MLKLPLVATANVIQPLYSRYADVSPSESRRGARVARVWRRRSGGLKGSGRGGFWTGRRTVAPVVLVAFSANITVGAQHTLLESPCGLKGSELG
eukprot:COSAG02_NODE_155_length_33066_cov_32.167562_4_plen_94_part_00